MNQDPIRPRYLQIDILKGIMIMLVIIDHAIPWNIRTPWEHSLWERISIPVFLVIMGFNAASSFKFKQLPVDSLKSYGRYVLKKLKRYLGPFVLIYLISTITGLIYYDSWQNLLRSHFDIYSRMDRSLLWFFIPPFYGPGSWFLPVVFTSILILPLLYWLYKQSPRIVLLGSILFEILIHFIIYFYLNSLQASFLTRTGFFFINAFCIGFWVADHPNLCQKSEKTLGVEQDQELKSALVDKQTKHSNSQKMPYHFYIVIIITLGALIFGLRPILNDYFGNSIISLFLIMVSMILVVGFYTYKPLGEFLVVFLLSIGICFLFYTIGHYYMEEGPFNPDNPTSKIGVQFTALLLFVFPYLLLMLTPAFRRSKVGAKFSYPQNENAFLWLLFLPSSFYLILYQQFWKYYYLGDSELGLYFFLIRGDYHFLAYLHSVFLILLVLRLIPQISSSKIINGVANIGKASFHILFTQIYVYAIIIANYGNHYLTPSNSTTTLRNLFGFLRTENYSVDLWIYVGIMWCICIPIGILWFKIEQWVWKRVSTKKVAKKTSIAS